MSREIRRKVAVFMTEGSMHTCFSEHDWQRLRERCEVCLCQHPEDVDAMDKADIVLTGWGARSLTNEYLARAPALKLWAHGAGSMAGLATEEVWRRGLILTTANGILAEGVAETAICYTVMALKQLLPLSQQMHKEQERKRGNGIFPPRELCHVSVGIVGYGKVGQHLLKLLRNFHNLTILVSDPLIAADTLRSLGAQKASLEEICAACDVIHNCVPWTPRTENLFGEEEFLAMQDNAIFINTGRGATVNEQALIAELSKGRLQAYLDVTYPEPPEKGSPLYSLPNCFLFPHLAGFAGTGRRRMGEFAVDEILRFMDGKELQGVVDRKVVEGMTGGKG